MPPAIRPLLFGYLRLRIGADPGAATVGRRLLAEFAHREGFVLGDVFIDADENAPQSALVALVERVRSADLDLSSIAVGVPNAGHLGSTPGAQALMRQRIEHDAQARVIVVQGLTRWHLPVDAASAVEVTIRRDFVELRYRHKCVAVMDRQGLRGWLAGSGGRCLPVDDVTWFYRPCGHVLLGITRAGVWTVHPDIVAGLLAQL